MVSKRRISKPTSAIKSSFRFDFDFAKNNKRRMARRKQDKLLKGQVDSFRIRKLQRLCQLNAITPNFIVL